MIIGISFDKLMDFLGTQRNKNLFRLTANSKNLLIKTELLSVGEKLEILELSLGLRFLTEAMAKIQYKKTPGKDGFTYPFTESIKEIQTFLEKDLGLLTYVSRKKSKRFNKYVHEVNIFANTAIKNYYIKFQHKIDSLEYGLLYGYHPKAIVAFCGFIDKVPPKKSVYAYQYYDSKVFPKDFYNEVNLFHKNKWEILKKYCPGIIEQAENEFKVKKKMLK